MKIKCTYCAEMMDSHLDECPHCGGPNKKAKSKDAQTIEELSNWIQEQGFDLSKVSIGENNFSAKHLGIYKDVETDEYVAYWNDKNGYRNNLYRGNEQSIAVSKLCEWIRKKNKKSTSSKSLIVCSHCGKKIDDSLMVCPYCGGPNDKAQRNAIEQPQTIDELKSWYKQNKLPPEDVTRFYIGKNITQAKVFGIYKDKNSGDFVVYKNKADGTRAVRYKGKDEAYAVNELYQRLKEEIVNQKTRNKKEKKAKTPQKKKEKGLLAELAEIFFSDAYGIAALILISSLLIGFIYLVYWFVTTPVSTGYYSYNNDSYYYDYDKSKWYMYDDDTEDWVYQSDVDDELASNKEEYYDSYSFNSDSGYYDIKEDSDYKLDHPPSSSSGSSNSSSWYNEDDDDDWGSSWDNDSSWDSSDSWDSGSTDWDSDW